jgi:hypothetical protein
MSKNEIRGITQMQGMLDKAHTEFEKLKEKYSGDVPENVLNEFNKGIERLQKQMDSRQNKLNEDKEIKNAQKILEDKKLLNVLVKYNLKYKRKRIGRITKDLNNSWWINTNSDIRNIGVWLDLGDDTQLFTYIINVELQNCCTLTLVNVNALGIEGCVSDINTTLYKLREVFVNGEKDKSNE